MASRDRQQRSRAIPPCRFRPEGKEMQVGRVIFVEWWIGGKLKLRRKPRPYSDSWRTVSSSALRGGRTGANRARRTQMRDVDVIIRLVEQPVAAVITSLSVVARKRVSPRRSMSRQTDCKSSAAGPEARPREPLRRLCRRPDLGNGRVERPWCSRPARLKHPLHPSRDRARS